MYSWDDLCAMVLCNYAVCLGVSYLSCYAFALLSRISAMLGISTRAWTSMYAHMQPGVLV